MEFLRLINLHPQPRPGDLYSVALWKDVESGVIGYELRINCEEIHTDAFEGGPGLLTDDEVCEAFEELCYCDDALDEDKAESLFAQFYEEIGQRLE